MASAVVDVWHPLLLAARTGRLADARRALANGESPDVHTAPGWTPIHSAAYNGHVAVVKLLIEHHANLELIYVHQFEEGNKYERTPLQQACLRDHPEVVEALLDAGANIEAGSPTHDTPLLSAARRGYAAIVSALLRHGANVNASGPTGWTSLHSASFYGYIPVIVLLIQYGADLTAVYNKSRTPLHKAAEANHTDAVALLLDSGADIEERTSDGFTPLYIAALYGSEASAQLLLERGGRVNAQSTTGWTPLHIAAKAGHPSLVQLLLSHDASTEARQDSQSWTPLHYAASGGFSDIVSNLLDHGANIEATADDGSTALHLATANGHLKVVALLLDRHANFKKKRKDIKTPLALAKENSHAAVITLLSSWEPNDDSDVSTSLSNLTISGAVLPGQQPVTEILARVTHGPETWLRKIDWINKLLASTAKPSGVRPVRIAVLDTGCSLDGGYFKDPTQLRRLRKGHWRDFSGSSTTPIDEDPVKHGTMVSSLVLRTARNAEVFVARVATQASELEGSEDHIVKAIEHAVDPEGWCVDIISMSFGFRKRVDSITRSIFAATARQQPVLFFAAAANNGSNERELFPAFMHEVISVRGTDSLGTFVGAYDPPPMRMNEHLPLCGTLGQNVPYAPGGESVSSGCSVAAPIMAGMVAIVMQWMAYKSDDEDAKTKLRTVAGIRELLKSEAVEKGNKRFYFHLWELFSDNNGKTRCVQVVESVMSGLP